MIIFLVGILCLSVFAIIYGLYFVLVLHTSKIIEYRKSIDSILAASTPLHELPKVSILVPAHNEENAISTKLKNITTMEYPRDRIELILIDDASTDRTSEIAEVLFRELSIPGRIIKNRNRSGVNACYNIGVAESNGDLILTTDADATVENDALSKGVSVLMSMEDIGGVTGSYAPAYDLETTATFIEKSHRALWERMATAESAIHSTFPGYTALTLLRKRAYSPMATDHGSSDGNISLGIIRRNLRFVHVPQMVFHEPILASISEQRRQKVRRAARLIQSTLANRDMVFNSDYRRFGIIVFPLRFAMMTVGPVLFIAGLILSLLGLMESSLELGIVVLSVLSSCWLAGVLLRAPQSNLVSSLIIHQFYLFAGLVAGRNSISVWKTPR